MTETTARAETPILDWTAVNQAYLEAQVRRLRLLLRRRAHWLRHQWQREPLHTHQSLVIGDAEADWLLAGEDRQAEARFYLEDPEETATTQTIAEVEEELARQAQAMDEAGAPPALEVLARMFDLSPFERDVLLLCLAPDLDPAFERLYAYVQDDVNCRYATPHLALSLFVPEGTDPAHRNTFLSGAPLRRFRLVSLEPGPLPGTAPAARLLRLDERMVDYLRGVNRPGERVVDLLRPLPPPLLAAPHRELVDRLARSFASGVGERPLPVLNLTGPPGTGKRTVARALGERLGLDLYRLDARRLPPPGSERGEMLCLLEREAALLGFGLYLDATGRDPADLATVGALEDAIQHLGTFLVVGSRERWQTDRETLAVRLSKPDTGAQRSLWQGALAGVHHSLDGHVEELVQQFDLGPEAISRAVGAAQSRARLRAPDDGAAVGAADLWAACRELAGWQLDELAQRIVPCYAWDDIVLPEDVNRQLREIAAQVANRPQVYETWGFGAKLSRGRGISALFAGPSGTGKTMAAEILARHLDLDLYRIDLAGVVSKYIGETEKNLKKVFDTAEESGAILFFDEADALFGKRTEVKDSHDRYANIEVNYLLQRMEDYRGLAILATNRKSALDRAFLRRLRFLVDFPFPDAASRSVIWQKVFPAKAAVEGLDPGFLARLEITGGNIRNIALNAAFLAADEGALIGMAQVMHATRREYAKIDKLATQAEFGPYSGSVRR